MAGDPGPWRQQAILGRSDWDADALRDIVRDYVIEHLADDDSVLVIDETGFLKQGKASCGVARQYTGSAGKITNRDENSWPVSWVTNMKPYNAVLNTQFLYVVNGTNNPAGARLFIRFLMGGADGKVFFESLL